VTETLTADVMNRSTELLLPMSGIGGAGILGIIGIIIAGTAFVLLPKRSSRRKELYDE